LDDVAGPGFASVKALPYDRSRFLCRIYEVAGASISNFYVGTAIFAVFRLVRGAVMVSFEALSAFAAVFAAKSVSFANMLRPGDWRLASSLRAVEARKTISVRRVMMCVPQPRRDTAIAME